MHSRDYFFYTHPKKDKPDLYCCALITGQHTQTFNIQQILKSLMTNGHVVNFSSCGNYSNILDSHQVHVPEIKKVYIIYQKENIYLISGQLRKKRI